MVPRVKPETTAVSAATPSDDRQCALVRSALQHRLDQGRRDQGAPPRQLAGHADRGARLGLREPPGAGPAPCRRRHRADVRRGRRGEGQRAQDHGLVLHPRQPGAGAARHSPRPPPRCPPPRRAGRDPIDDRHRPRLRLGPLLARRGPPHRRGAGPRTRPARRREFYARELPPCAARGGRPLHPRRRPQRVRRRAHQGCAVDRDGRPRQATRLPRRQHRVRRLAARSVLP